MGLFAAIPPSPPSPELQNRLDVGAPLAAMLNTEKARSEGMISPVLVDFWWRYRGRIGLYSGNDFDADSEAGLSGYCDFLISRVPQQPFVTPPVVVVVEAKRETRALDTASQRWSAPSGSVENRRMRVNPSTVA